jgi:hypothetical protein
MDDTRLLKMFDTQIRRVPESLAGFQSELLTKPAPMLRVTPIDADAAGWGGGVFWCDLDKSTADAAIADAIEWFRPRGREFEWKHYGYDRPTDLPKRLAAAGFKPDREETLVIGEVTDIRKRLARATAPKGITIRKLRNDAAGTAVDWQGINDLHRAVWGDDNAETNAAVAAAIAADPLSTSMWVAVADSSIIVCAGRINFHEGTDFASLWGGSTLKAYRDRGIYKALVSCRADEAAKRGFRFLQVDASPASRPILERLSLRALTSTTPWKWRP